MKARQTQATSPKVSSPCQRCPEGKCRSRTSATLRRCSVASRTGMSSTRTIRCTWGQSLFIPSLLFPYSFWKTLSGVCRTGGKKIDGKKLGPLPWGTLYGGVKMARDAAEYLEHPSTWAEHQRVREGIMK